MPEKTRTTVYLTEQDRQRLARLRERYGLGVSAAVRAGLALLERQMDTALMREAKERDMIRKEGQTVIWEWDDENRGTFYNQTITDIVVDDEGYCEGVWKGKHVAAFSLATGEWFPI